MTVQFGRSVNGSFGRWVPGRTGPADRTVSMTEAQISASASFLVPITGEIMTMPGPPKHPAAEETDVDEQGRISGLFASATAKDKSTNSERAVTTVARCGPIPTVRTIGRMPKDEHNTLHERPVS